VDNRPQSQLALHKSAVHGSASQGVKLVGFYQKPEVPNPVIEEKGNGIEIWRYRDGRVYEYHPDQGAVRLETMPIQGPEISLEHDLKWKNRHHRQEPYNYRDYANRADAYNVAEACGDIPTFDCFDKDTRLKIKTAIDGAYGELDEAIAEPVYS